MDTKRKVIIDCDPGIDDMFALILCIRHLDVRGIVAVGGNTGLEYTQRNARFATDRASGYPGVCRIRYAHVEPACAGHRGPRKRRHRGY